MPNKTIQLDEPALEGQTLTLRIYDGVTLVQNTLATATATTGRFTWTVGAAVTAKEYQVRVYIGSFMAGTYYVYFENGDVEGTYRAYNFSRAEIVEPILNKASTSGSGSVLYELTITKNSLPEDGVAVWITTDQQGTDVIAGTKYTDGNGKVEFLLDPGVYYAWCQKNRVKFTNPTSFEVPSP